MSIARLSRSLGDRGTLPVERASRRVSIARLSRPPAVPSRRAAPPCLPGHLKLGRCLPKSVSAWPPSRPCQPCRGSAVELAGPSRPVHGAGECAPNRRRRPADRRRPASMPASKRASGVPRHCAAGGGPTGQVTCKGPQFRVRFCLQGPPRAQALPSTRRRVSEASQEGRWTRFPEFVPTCRLRRPNVCPCRCQHEGAQSDHMDGWVTVLIHPCRRLSVAVGLVPDDCGGLQQAFKKAARRVREGAHKLAGRRVHYRVVCGGVCRRHVVICRRDVGALGGRD